MNGIDFTTKRASDVARRTAPRKPDALPKEVTRLAARHGLDVGRVHDELGGYYFVRDPKTQKIVEMTRTAFPKVCHAKAMIRRHLGSQCKQITLPVHP